MRSMNIASLRRPAWRLVIALAALAGCTPRLDWREVRPEGAGVLAMFPCKPALLSRPAAAPGEIGPLAAMGLASCEANGMSFSLAWTEVSDPTLLNQALLEMRESLQTRLQAEAGPLQSLSIAAATPNPQAGQQSLLVRREGRLQPGRLAVFARGLRVYQLLLLGARSEAQAEQAWDNFAGALRLEP